MKGFCRVMAYLLGYVAGWFLANHWTHGTPLWWGLGLAVIAIAAFIWNAKQS